MADTICGLHRWVIAEFFYTLPYQNHWQCQFWHQSQWIYGVVVGEIHGIGCRLDIDTTLVVPKLPQIDPSDAEKLHGLSLKMSTEEVMTLISQLAETMESQFGISTNCWRRKVCRSWVKVFMTWRQEIEATVSESAGHHWLTYSKVLNILKGCLGDWSLECLLKASCQQQSNARQTNYFLCGRALRVSSGPYRSKLISATSVSVINVAACEKSKEGRLISKWKAFPLSSATTNWNSDHIPLDSVQNSSSFI